MGDSTFLCCAYCWKHEDLWDNILSFKCDGCNKRVHYECIRSPQPSALLADTFYRFKCTACGERGKEEFHRSNISWLNAILLALYNLHMTETGTHGYFHWKSHICAFFNKHWATIFGQHRRKTGNWIGTMAGVLSAGCPQFFESGANVADQGYWGLVVRKPPLPQAETKILKERKKAEDFPVSLEPQQLRCRKSQESSLLAAIELKEKQLQFAKLTKKRNKNSVREMEIKCGPTSTVASNCDSTAHASSTSTQPRVKLKSSHKQKRKATAGDAASLAARGDVFCPPRIKEEPCAGNPSESLNATSSSSSSLTALTSQEDSENSTREDLFTEIKMEADIEVDIDIDIGSSLMIKEELWPDLRPTSPDISTMLAGSSDSLSGSSPSKWPASKTEYPVDVKIECKSDVESEGQSEKDIKEVSEGEDISSDEDAENSENGRGSQDEKESVPAEIRTDNEMPFQKRKKKRPRKRRRPTESPPPSSPSRLTRISVFEEGELLQKLNQAASGHSLKPEMAQLRRKLICNQTNREFGLPVFDLGREMEKMAQGDSSFFKSLKQDGQFVHHILKRSVQPKETRDLDRFMIQGTPGNDLLSRQYSRFHQRLVGFEDNELRPTVSPYTTRVLLPFIWRNYNPSVKPLKMRLLQEILAYPHRNDPCWIPPSSPPIDYCYVRPEHIASVNALSREFFWPGIDISECLQYPDFSCVVLYRKIVIGFAFMVPDRGYHEAYISFIFTHPEWRGAGIATFMMYHLTQTCMGKDLLLHVSATNPAMLLYQKFGFKAEELILNFYHKYFPLNCTDSTNAFLMRLSR